MIGADGPDACVDLVRVVIQTGIEFRVGLRDPLGLPGDPALTAGIGLGMWGADGGARRCIHIVQYSPGNGQSPARRILASSWRS